ncbi:hypothetical protein [Streptomyces sp. NPDC056723]|uniref:hypothetical protein n=1 Tax=Streptomyces sp. NPDC056723 TaxID=3345925 RepID=UPI003674C272
MSKKEGEFNPWQWDRDNARNGRARLTIERNGHQVCLDHQGVSIDGERIVRDDPSQGTHGFDVEKDGTVVYRGQPVAAIEHREGEAGEVTVWGKGGPTLPERRQRELAQREREENERKERDDRYRDRQQYEQREIREQTL